MTTKLFIILLILLLTMGITSATTTITNNGNEHTITPDAGDKVTLTFAYTSTFYGNVKTIIDSREITTPVTIRYPNTFGDMYVMFIIVQSPNGFIDYVVL